MKKKLSILLALSLILSLCLSACGNDDNPSNSQNVTSTKTPEDVIISTDELLSYYDFDIDSCVKLGEYKNLEINLSDTYEITDQSVIEYINMYLSYYGDVKETDRTIVQDGDTVVIDFVGKIDGEPFDGGTATGYKTTIGSGGMIDGFQEGIIGHSKGEQFDLTLKFPTPYENNLELSGKDVVFTIVVNEIYEPVKYTYDTLTDEYVKNTFQVDTVEEYVKLTKEQMQENADSQKESDAEQEYLKMLMENSEVTIPDDYMDAYCSQIMSQVEIYAKNTLNMELEAYIKEYENYDTIEDFKDGLKEQLKTETEQQFILDAIIKAEGRTITQVGYEDFVDYYLSLYSLTEEEFYKQYGEKESIMLIYAENSLLADLMKDVKINVGVQTNQSSNISSELPSITE